MEKAIEVWEIYSEYLRPINCIILVTDRFGLRDEDKTSPYRIKEWRRNGWQNHEGKPIKNHKQLDSLDKTRKKLTQVSRCRVQIIFRRRKQNKVADKLAKAGKKEGPPIHRLAKKGEKIGRRKFDGTEITYSKLRKELSLHINVFRKDPVQNEWEVWVEICTGESQGCKLKIYTDNILGGSLKRGNEYVIKVKEIFKHHIKIYYEIVHMSKKTDESETGS